jgi:hypothetical protein
MDEVKGQILFLKAVQCRLDKIYSKIDDENAITAAHELGKLQQLVQMQIEDLENLDDFTCDNECNGKAESCSCLSCSLADTCINLKNHTQ